jgi:hypothetical protein
MIGLVTPLDVVRQRFSPEPSKGETEQKLSFRQCRTVFCLQTDDEPLRKIFPVLCEVVVNLKKDSLPRFHLHTVRDPSSATSSYVYFVCHQLSLPCPTPPLPPFHSCRIPCPDSSSLSKSNSLSPNVSCFSGVPILLIASNKSSLSK